MGLSSSEQALSQPMVGVLLSLCLIFRAMRPGALLSLIMLCRVGTQVMHRFSVQQMMRQDFVTTLVVMGLSCLVSRVVTPLCWATALANQPKPAVTLTIRSLSARRLFRNR